MNITVPFGANNHSIADNPCHIWVDFDIFWADAGGNSHEIYKDQGWGKDYPLSSGYLHQTLL